VTASELRKALLQRRKALRRGAKLLAAEARRRVDEHPEIKRARARRRLRHAMSLGLLALLLYLARCDCQGPPPPPAPDGSVGEVDAPEPQPTKPPRTAPASRKPLPARVAAQPRPPFEAEAPSSPAWLAEFRLQVAARSPRLAACFTGSRTPGALRWSASINPASGIASDHELKPARSDFNLKREQRECLVQALSRPTYRLNVPQAVAVPDRIGMVIEF
jgi:hypothetical protein